MPNWVIYDTANDRVKQYIKSSPIDPIYPVGANEGAIKDPDLFALIDVPLKYWIQNNGSIVEMTQAEKDQVDADELTQVDTNVRTGAKNLIDGFNSNQLLLRSLIETLVDEVNTLRALHGLPDRNLSQAKTTIKNKIDAGGSIDEKP